MKKHFYYNILRKTTIQFLDMFNDIHIARYSKTGDVEKYVKVPLKFAPKTKQWWWAEKRDRDGGSGGDKLLPMMAAFLTNVEFDNERKVNSLWKMTGKRDSDDVVQVMNPMPFNFTYTIEIIAEYMIDIMQIVEQTLPFFDPVAQIRLQLPDLYIGNTQVLGGFPLELKTSLEGVTSDTPVELDEANFRMLKWELNFKVEGYLFKPVEQSKIIRKVVTKVYTDENAWDNYSLDTSTEDISGVGHQDVEILTYATSASKYDDDGNILYNWEIYE